MTGPNDTIARLGLTVDAVFVPWSQSRNFKPTPNMSDRSLNWRVTLKCDGREVLTSDYSAGIGDCPSYKFNARPTLEYAGRIAYETEEGKSSARGKPIHPKPADVLYSLVMGGSAIDYATFEEWAAEYGYDPDSRKAETMYRACLEVGLKLRAALGDAGLAELRAAFQDY